jgi:hypothetical protein
MAFKNKIALSCIHMPTKLTPEIIAAAIVGFESHKARIDAQIAELRQMLSGDPAASASTPEPPTRKRRKMSAAGRARIAEAQRKRWAASKKAAQPSAPGAAPKPKRILSAAGRRAISEATKKRWAAVKAAKAQHEKAAAKKPAKKAANKRARLKETGVKKSALKRTTPAAAQGVTETGGQ